MEFHAYPSSPPRSKGEAASFQALWRAHGLLHQSDNVLIPAVLLSVSVALAMYQHAANGDTRDYSTRNFLVLVLLSMLPVAFLERRLMACADPLGAIAKFSPKVFLMHTLFLAIRCAACGLVEQYQTRFFFCRSAASFAAACCLLPTVFGLRPTRAALREHRDVLLLSGAAVLAALSTEWADAYLKGALGGGWMPAGYRGRFAVFAAAAMSDYIEILAFVPAMWMVVREGGGAHAGGADVASTQGRALALFAFILTFYTGEDLHNAFSLGTESPCASAGHLAHFLLLLDFSAYILSHLYDPTKCEKLMGRIWNLITDSSAV